MELGYNPNDCARQAHPSFGVFRGRYAALVAVGALMALMVFFALSRAGVDFFPTLAISLVPMGLMAAWVILFVNGKPKSYTFDLMLFGRFVFRVWLYRNGLIPRPPMFNIAPIKPEHPTKWSHE
jgi:hypothetical protein